MFVKLPTEHQLMFLSLKGGCTGSSESTLVKITHCCRGSYIVSFVDIFYLWRLWRVSEIKR